LNPCPLFYVNQLLAFHEGLLLARRPESLQREHEEVLGMNHVALATDQCPVLHNSRHKAPDTLFSSPAEKP